MQEMELSKHVWGKVPIRVELLKNISSFEPIYWSAVKSIIKKLRKKEYDATMMLNFSDQIRRT